MSDLGTDGPFLAKLRNYLNAPADDEFVADALAEGDTLVDGLLDGDTAPDGAHRAAVRDAAANLYHSRRVRNGVATFDGPDMAPIRVTRDPLVGARAILAPYLSPRVA